MWLTATLVASIYSCIHRRWLLYLALISATVTAALNWVAYLVGGEMTLMLGMMAALMFFAMTAVTIFDDVLREARVTVDKIHGAGQDRGGRSAGGRGR